jgi:NAD(P)-dependent dehydrogenase (short-subunit alcohol dehydrogenase family)
MPNVLASELLQPGLLEGLTMLLAAPAGGLSPDAVNGGVAAAVGRACAALGADVRVCPLPRGESGQAATEQEIEQLVELALEPGEHVELLAVDCAGLFGVAESGEGRATEEGDDARAPLIACMEDTWNVTRALANRSFLPAQRGGRIVYIAPAASAGVHADAARAGLENLARTLSVEWARHRVTAVAIAPGDDTSAEHLAALTAYLASPAGAYFSGCLLDLRGPGRE